jgi:CheY-like chemotaxis protein
MDAHALSGRRLLIVDDDAPSRELLRTLFVAVGAEVVEAANGVEAVEACASDAYDAILMDIQMPQMDGIEATRAIRAAESGTPEGSAVLIIAVTAHAMNEHRRLCLDAGMDAVITKPIDPLTVVEEVSRLVMER